MPHLARMAEDYSKKGLNVIAITNESRETVLKYMEQLALVPLPYTIGVGGGANEYPASGIPKAFLIGADGKIAWEGNPSAFNEKQLDEELKKVKVTDEMHAARAAKALAYAETLIGKKDVFRAANLLDKVSKDAKAGDAAKKAADRLAAIQADAALKNELEAQKTLDKAVGGLELPREKVKDKDREGKAKAIDALAKKFKDTAPATAEMATTWAKVVREDWKAEH
jgi:hypothetical protein